MKLGVIGVGDLTEKMIRGLHGKAGELNVVLSPRGEARSRALAQALSVERLASNQAVVDAADIVLIGVRPAQLAALAGELRFRPGQKVISVVAGVSIAELRELFGDIACCRAMTSLSAEVNCATVAVYPDDAQVSALLAPLGSLVALASEAEFELATVAACANGWFYFLLHDMQQWFVGKGLSPERARALVLSSVESCTGYVRHHAAASIGEIGESIAQPGTFTARGLDEWKRLKGDAAWLAACDTVANALTAKPGDAPD